MSDAFTSHLFTSSSSSSFINRTQNVSLRIYVIKNATGDSIAVPYIEIRKLCYLPQKCRNERLYVLAIVSFLFCEKMLYTFKRLHKIF